MDNKQSKRRRLITKKWISITLVTILSVVVVSVGLVLFGWINRSTIIDLVQEWYALNHDGKLSIGEVNTNFSDFPKIGFTIHDIRHSEFDSLTDKSVTIHIQRTDIVVRTFDLLRGDLNITKVALKNAQFISEVNPSRPFSYYVRLKLEKKLKENDPFNLPGFMDASGAEILVEDSRFLLKDTTLNKYFEGSIDRFSGEYYAADNLLHGQADMDVTILALGFNMLKGAYLKNTHATGTPRITYDPQLQQIKTDTFTLSLDHQHFETSASFGLSDTGGYSFYLRNPETDLAALKGFLADSIAANIAPFQLLNPFQTEGIIEGEFGYRQFPVVKVDFASSGNRLTISDHIEMTNASFSGLLTTDIYASDSIRMKNRSRQDIRISFDSLTSYIDDISMRFGPSYFQSSPDALNFINASVKMHGDNEDLARLADAENFQFEGGTFDFEAAVSGDIPNPWELLNHAQGTFLLENTLVSLKRNQLGLPVEKLLLLLQRDTAELRHLEINLAGSNNIIFTGWLTHLADLLADDAATRTTGHVELTSDHIDVNEIIAISTRFLPESRPSTQDRKNLYETIDILYRRFHPEVRVDVNSLNYKGVTLDKVRGILTLRQPEVVSVRSFEFDYNESTTSVKGDVRVPPPVGSINQPISVDIQASSQGKMTAIHELFQIELMDVLSGEFSFEGKVDARVNRFQDLLYEINGDLILRDNTYYYAPADLRIHLDSLTLVANQSSLYLEDFEFDLGDLQNVRLQGRVRQFPDFLLGKEQTEGSVTMYLHFPKVNADTIINRVDKMNSMEPVSPQQEKKKLFTVFEDLNHFDPTIEISFDSLTYRGLDLYDITSRFAFQNDSILRMEKLDIYYKKSRAEIMGHVLAPQDTQNVISNDPFEFDLTVKARGPNVDLNNLLRSTNFIFQSGNFLFTGRYQGESESLALSDKNASANLELGPSRVYNKTSGLVIPVDRLEVEINNNLARLTSLDIDLPGESSLDFSGTINNFTSFINSESGRHRSAFRIQSDYLDIEDLKTFFESSESTGRDSPERDSSNIADVMKKIGETLDGIVYSFNPTLHLEFDSLRYNQQVVNDFRTSFSFDQKGDLIAENMSMQLYEGNVDLSFLIGRLSRDGFPVEIKTNIERIDINKMLTDLDYFGMETLKEAERIEGIANVLLDVQGQIDDQGALIYESLNGSVSIELNEFKLYGFEPLLEKVSLFRKERFEKLQFQPIVQTFTIVNGEILIPRTEIQSSALQFFIEGRVKLEDYLNIWISIPWKNLNKNEGLTLPDKTTFEQAGAKFFIQLVQDPDHPRPSGREMQINIRLSNRELRKQRGK